jgi:hypothetical protein
MKTTTGERSPKDMRKFARGAERRPRNNREVVRMDDQESGKDWMPAEKEKRRLHIKAPSITDRDNSSLLTQSWVGAKSCLLSVDTRAGKKETAWRKQ